MATEPQKSNLLNLLSDTVSSNGSAIESLQESLIEIEEIIDYFQPSCIGFDSEILSLVSDINTIKGEIVILNSNANAAGCGTTVGLSTIRQDIVRTLSYNISSDNYDGEDPFDITISTLSNGNIGYGTFLTYTQNDSTTGIGTSFANIGICSGFPCIPANCVSYASSIAAKESQITVLRNELSVLINPINIIKEERVDYQLRRYGDKYSIRILTEENIKVSIAITTLNNPIYDPYT